MISRQLDGAFAALKRRHNPARALMAVVALVAASASCSRTPSSEPAVTQTAAVSPPGPGGSVPHGDHNPHHGGVVMMKGDDLHYEVVLDQTGHDYRVYFSDAIREDLPASVASDVVLTIHRPDAADERIPLQIDDAGESWTGRGRVVAAPAAASVRIAFTIRQQPYWIDLPFAPAKK